MYLNIQIIFLTEPFRIWKSRRWDQLSSWIYFNTINSGKKFWSQIKISGKKMMISWFGLVPQPGREITWTDHKTALLSQENKCKKWRKKMLRIRSKRRICRWFKPLNHASKDRLISVNLLKRLNISAIIISVILFQELVSNPTTQLIEWMNGWRIINNQSVPTPNVSSYLFRYNK